MAENSIQEWLADCKNLSPVEIHSFASTLIQSHDLIHSVFNVLENKIKQHELVEPVCNQLFTFYRSHEVELQHFVIQFIPTLIGVYLASLGQPELKAHRAVEVLILGIYNLDVVNAHGKPLTHSFQLPSLAQPSIYHESLSTITTTDNILRGMDKTEPQIVTLGPFPQVDTLNGQNRLWVMTILMNIYNANLSFIPKPSLRFTCKTCSRLVKQGFFRPGHHQRSSYGNETLFTNLAYQRANQRISLSPALLLELLHATYFAMYNGHYQVAVQALEDIHIRAAYEMFPEVLLVTNAVRSSLKLSPTGQAFEEPMGINVALSPSTPTPNLSKAIITNASFRTKKLPDDIPIQETNDKPLTTISEEQEEVPNNDKEKPKPIKVKEKISVGNLIAKAKGMRKESDASPAASKSKEKKKSDDSVSSGKGVNPSSGSKLQNGEDKDGKTPPGSGRSMDIKLDDVDATRRNISGRRSSDTSPMDTSSKVVSWREVGNSESRSVETRSIKTDDRRLSDPKVIDAPTRSAGKIPRSNGKGSGGGRGKGGVVDNLDEPTKSGEFLFNRNIDGIPPGLNSTSDPSSSSSRRSEELTSNAVLRIVDGRIADISRSVDSVRLTNGKGNRLSKIERTDDDDSDRNSDIPSLKESRLSRLSDDWVTPGQTFETRLDAGDDRNSMDDDKSSTASPMHDGRSGSVNEYSLIGDGRKMNEPGIKRYENRMEMKPLINSKQDMSDSSEETEQSFSLDISNSLSNVSDSDEEYIHSRSMERKVQRESVHTFV